MRKVIGIGETILDIIFRNGQPTELYRVAQYLMASCHWHGQAYL